MISQKSLILWRTNSVFDEYRDAMYRSESQRKLRVSQTLYSPSHHALRALLIKCSCDIQRIRIDLDDWAQYIVHFIDTSDISLFGSVNRRIRGWCSMSATCLDKIYTSKIISLQALLHRLDIGFVQARELTSSGTLIEVPTQACAADD